MAARKPIPTEIKKIMGNPGKRALPKPGEEPQPELYTDMPPPPIWLGMYGRQEWERVGPTLLNLRLLSDADFLTFGAYCAAVDLMIESKLDVDKNGTTIRGARGEVRNPALASFGQAITAMRALATEFGMTPSSRARMRLPGDEGDTLEDLLSDDGEDDAK